jgi:hypothetical protein
MFRIIFAFLILIFSGKSFAQNIHLVNGNYFVDGKFKKYDNLYIVDGLFSSKKPNKVDTILNLSNQFIIPPFAEGHTHKLDNPKELKKDIKTFVDEGVFYALVLNNFSSNVDNNRAFLSNLNQLDVQFANGGFTTTGQHPSFAYERITSNIQDWWSPANTSKIKNSRKAENDAYWFMDSIEDVNKKWEAYLKTRPDILKVYLLNINKNETQEPKTLSERTLKYIVRKAKLSNLRVVAHIESFDDLKIALKCGIRIFGHMPHYNVNYEKTLPNIVEFSKEEKRLIKKLKPIMTPTLSFNEQFSIVRSEKNNYQGEFDSVSYNRSLSFQRATIQKLSDNGFSFAIGSDGDYLSSELFYWVKNRIFPYEKAIEIATKNTSQLIFPNRRIGEIKNGFEASFLVFDKNPLEDFNELKQIKLKVKKGEIIE